MDHHDIDEDWIQKVKIPRNNILARRNPGPIKGRSKVS